MSRTRAGAGLEMGYSKSSRTRDAFASTAVKVFGLIDSGRCVAIKANSIERNIMLWTIIVILVVLWLLGFIGHFGGGLIHLLLVVAVVIVIINLIQGRRGP
jgi:hypothetical protein